MKGPGKKPVKKEDKPSTTNGEPSAEISAAEFPEHANQVFIPPIEDGTEGFLPLVVEKPRAEKPRKRKSWAALVTKVVPFEDKFRMHLTTEAPEDLYQYGNAHYHLKHTQKGFAILTGSLRINKKKIILTK